METQKWYALDQVCDAIREVGDVVYLNAGLFGSSHKRFYVTYCLTSKRVRCAMIETIKKHNKENGRYTQSQQEPESFQKIKAARRKEEENNKVYLVKTGPTTILECMTRVLQYHESGSHDLNSSNALTGFEQNLYLRLQQKGLRTLIRLPNEHFELKSTDPDEVFNRKLCFHIPRSFCTQGIISFKCKFFRLCHCRRNRPKVSPAHCCKR